jgi:thioredoxin reductase (NADPH)
MQKLPILLVVDDDEQVLSAIRRDLRKAYRETFRIVSTSKPLEALEVIEELKKKNEEIALMLTDQRMPEMNGVDLLEKARKIYPKARRVLLTAYSDTEAAIRAINEVQLDYYLLKPWDPPEEKLYPVLNELLDDWSADYKPGKAGTRLIGYQFSPKTHRIKDFLAGNLVPYQWMDIDSHPEAGKLLELTGLSKNQLPALLFEDGSALADPELKEIGEKIGLKVKAGEEIYDVAIIGAGPAGLAAAVYGGSEGLKTTLIEKRAPGGQAGTSSRIENYLGFPNGLSGSELTRRALTQATRFGAEFLSPVEVAGIEVSGSYKILKMADGSKVNARAVILTTGVDYRKLEAEGIEEFTGAGVYYGAATTEAHTCQDQPVYIVGGGNSAGQAAMYLSKFARNVYIVIRKEDLSSSMSQYLIEQIGHTPNIKILGNSVVQKVSGNGKMEKILIKNLNSNEVIDSDCGGLMIFIGAKPFTDWIPELILKNEKGFIQTGTDLKQFKSFRKNWPLQRDPFLLETSVPGIFAAGDVRAGAMNRVASAVGEGAMAVKFVHQYLAET